MQFDNSDIEKNDDNNFKELQRGIILKKYFEKILLRY